MNRYKFFKNLNYRTFSIILLMLFIRINILIVFSKLAGNGSTLKFEKPAPMYRKPRIAK